MQSQRSCNSSLVDEQEYIVRVFGSRGLDTTVSGLIKDVLEAAKKKQKGKRDAFMEHPDDTAALFCNRARCHLALIALACWRFRRPDEAEIGEAVRGSSNGTSLLTAQVLFKTPCSELVKRYSKEQISQLRDASGLKPRTVNHVYFDEALTLVDPKYSRGTIAAYRKLTMRQLRWQAAAAGAEQEAEWEG
ncbi:hypothetical protein JCM10296v2_002678 [Rhodotorula toruloides]